MDCERPSHIPIHALMFGVGLADVRARYILAADGVAIAIFLIVGLAQLSQANI